MTGQPGISRHWGRACNIKEKDQDKQEENKNDPTGNRTLQRKLNLLGIMKSTEEATRLTENKVQHKNEHPENKTSWKWPKEK